MTRTHACKGGAFLALIFFPGLLILGCHGGHDESPILLSINVTPVAPSVAKGLKEQFKAVGIYSNSTAADITAAVSWSSGTPATATIGPSGLAAAVAVGSTTITATTHLLSGNTTLTVTPAELQSISVTPATTSVAKGQTQQFKAIGTFSDGGTADLTSTVAWHSGATGVASVSVTGLATSLAVGSAGIIAKSGTISANATLSVTPAVLQSLNIAPQPAAVALGFSTQLSATEKYTDGSSGTLPVTWTSATPSVATVAANTGMATSVALGTSTISATAGSLTATVVLSVVTNAWVATTSLPTERQLHGATLLVGGSVLVAGGVDAGPLLSSELYNPTTSTWNPTGNLITPRFQHGQVVLSDGKVLVAGGLGGSTGNSIQMTLTSAEIYDSATGTWSATADMGAARRLHTVTMLPDGNVLVVGGQGSGEIAMSSAEIYNPAAGTWTPAGNLLLGRYQHTATLLLNGKVLVAGGMTVQTHLITSNESEIFDPATGAWTATGSMIVSRYAHTATLLPDGNVLVAGGALLDTSSGGGPIYTSAEIYSIATGTWLPAGNMNVSRAGHTATLLQHGNVLVAGGGYNSSNTEIYNPSAGTWSLTGVLNENRVNHTATLLPNGTVLVAGGVIDSTGAFVTGQVANAEIFYPGTGN